MTKLEASDIELKKSNAFDGTLNATALDMVSVLDKDVPFTMALTLANFTMSSFIGHFHFKMKLGDDNFPPMNMICFILAKSGAKKTSSIVNLEKALKKGLKIINDERQLKLDAFLSSLGEDAEDLPASQKVLAPLSNALGTEAGMIQRINDFKNEGIGMPAMVVDEIATELQTSSDIVDMIKLTSELFDDGNKKSKPLKDRESQSEEITGMGQTSVFIGSEHGLLDDMAILKKFFDEFISKLARRCFFIYPEFQELLDDYDNFDAILEEDDREDQLNEEILERINMISMAIAIAYKDNEINHMEIDDKALRLYKAYKINCIEKAKTIISEPVNLEQQHRHWKVLKMAGVYAIWNRHNRIQVQDVKEAINCAEKTSGDLEKFINKASREPYEILLEHFLSGLSEELTVHEMVKLGWIKRQTQLKDILILANSKIGKEGILEEYHDKVIYTKYERTDTVGISFKKLNGTKEERKFQITDEFVHKKAGFPGVGKILAQDTAYIPFKFKTEATGAIINPKEVERLGRNMIGGIRGKDNIVGGADFIMLDIDDTDMPIDECHDMLADYRHVMARTSDPDNPYKYRVLMPTDIVVDIEGSRWMKLMKQIGTHLNMNIDILPQSQIYYGFAGRELLINEEGEDLEISSILQQIGEPVREVKRMQTEAQFTRAWEDRREIFKRAYDTKSGGGQHLALYVAMKYAWQIGFGYHENVHLLGEIVAHLAIEGRPPRDSFLPSLHSQRLKYYKLTQDEANALLDDETA